MIHICQKGIFAKIANLIKWQIINWEENSKGPKLK